MTPETSTRSTQHFLKLLLPPSTRAMLSTEQVTEILSLNAPQIIPIPDVPVEVMGVLNWRGEVLWLVDLGYLLEADPLFRQPSRHGNYRALVVHHESGFLGLVVNQANETFWCAPSEIQRLSETQRINKLSRCLQGYWTDPQGEIAWVLDCEAVVKLLGDKGG